MYFPIIVICLVWIKPSELNDKEISLKDKTKTKRNQRELPDSANGDEITEYLKSLQNRADDIDNFSHPATSKTIDNDQLIQELREQDVLEAVNFGINAMRERYFEKEPKLYALGLYLEDDNPASYVAAFNNQSEVAKYLARYSYAILEGASMLVKKFSNIVNPLPLSKTVIKQSPLQEQCPRRGIPNCPATHLKYRTLDGSCNNLNHLWWGSAMSAMQRFLPASYNDGIQTIRKSKTGRPLPSPRAISHFIHEDKNVPLSSVTHMLMQWGQFIDHDLTATGQTRSFNGSVPQCCLGGGIDFQPQEFMHPECLPIAVSSQDRFFGRLGVRCLEFTRSGSAPDEDCVFTSREQLSQVTSYLDASMIYSSNDFHSNGLRIFRNGLLQYGKLQSKQFTHPMRDSDICRLGSLSTSCFRAGDGRLSEQPALTSLHVLFLRLHNRIATDLSTINPHWNDETLFQETRKIIGAIVQHITYREFLPIVLGRKVMQTFDLQLLRKDYYNGYDNSVNPNVGNSFSTAAYRFGHSLVQQSFVRFDDLHRPIFNNVTIHDEFNNPANLETAGSLDRLLLGLVNQPCQRRDEFITNELTNHLFQTSGFRFGMDLASINIQRGRDHGLPAYVNWREPCSLSSIKSFDDLEKIMPVTTVNKFRLLYASVEDIDLFSAGLAEKSVNGGMVGPTFACIIAQQFRNLRRGDRFWYENPFNENAFTPDQLAQIRRVTLGQIFCKTMDDIKTIQPFVFLVSDESRNRRTFCNDIRIGQLDLTPWKEVSKIRSSRKSLKNDHQQGSTFWNKIFPRPKPSKPDVIHQENKIVVKRPYGGNWPSNFSIVVQNNAVHSPVYVNDAIYGSSIQLQTTTQNPPFATTVGNNLGTPGLAIINYPTGQPVPTGIPNYQGTNDYFHFWNFQNFNSRKTTDDKSNYEAQKDHQSSDLDDDEIPQPMKMINSKEINNTRQGTVENNR